MTREPACALLRHIRRLVADVPDPPRDGELLARFTRSRDEDAFAELVRRHGGMVLGVCGSVLRDRQDAEDAFQATFLAPRKAHTIRKPGSLAGWLHGVARRIARKLSARAARRPESPAGDLHALPARPMDDLTWREMRAALYEELERLPERNRLPLLLCHLEGQTQDEAARQLGWTLGTLRGRLLRGRELLRARLRRRGLDPSASLLAAVLSQGEASAVPPVLAASVTRSAVSAVAGGAIVSGRVAGLADAALGAMSLARLKAAAAALLVFAMVGSGALAVYSAGEEPPAKESGATPAVATEERAEPEEEESVRTDLLGDPLPRGAVARVGTERLCGMGPIVFLAGGKTLVSGDGLGRVTFWDTQTGKELRSICPENNDLRLFAAAPDGQTLITIGRKSELFQVWDVPTGKELHRFPTGGWVRDATFSPDGKTFAATVDKIGVVLWETAGWRKTRTLPGNGIALGSLTFLTDNKTLITETVSAGDVPRTIHWWDTETGRELRRVLDPSPAEVRSGSAFSPDGKMLAVVTADSLVLWDTVRCAEVHRLGLRDGHDYRPPSFSPDGKVVVCTAGYRGKNRILFFDVATGNEVRRWENEWYAPDNPTFSPDGKILAYSSAGIIRLRDVESGNLLLELPHLPMDVMTLGFTPDGGTLLTLCRTGNVGFWDRITGKPRVPLTSPPDGFSGPPNFMHPADLSPDGRRVAMIGAERWIHLWEPATGERLGRIDFSSDGLVMQHRPIFSPDGNLLAAKDGNGGIRLWDVVADNLRLRVRVSHNWVWPRAFTPDGRLLITSSTSYKDPTIRFWDVKTGEEVSRLSSSDETIATQVQVSPDGRTLVSIHEKNEEPTGPDGTLREDYADFRVWDRNSGRLRHRIPKAFWLLHPLAISPDSKTFASLDVRGTLTLWEVATGQSRGQFTGHRDLIQALAFSPNGRLLASGSEDRTALVWDLTGLAPDGRWPPRDLPPASMEQLWADLGGTDGVRAYRTIWRMAAAPEKSVPFLAERLRPVAPADEDRIARLLADLDCDRFPVRERASEELRKLNELAEPAMRKALAKTDSEEARRRLAVLLERVERRSLTPEQLRTLRALEALEHAATREARELLRRMAGGAPEAWPTREAKAALERLGGGAKAASGATPP